MKIEEIRADRLDSGGTTVAIEKLAGKSMPWSNAFPTTELAPGMCAGFAAGSGDAHQLVNPGPDVVEFLEVGDRACDDEVQYPDDDLAAKLGPDGKWRYHRKDGTLY